jgi:GTPase SAR1 family protein
MRIGILHLSDLHFSTNQKLENKFKALNSAIHVESHNVSRLFVVVTGDIAFSGKQEEYEKFKTLFDRIAIQLTVPVEKIIVPGNHDCNFDKNNQLRDNTIISVDYNIVGDDKSVIDSCLTVQQDFWNFFKQYQTIPENRLYYTVDYNLGKKKIKFICLNSAWMSSLHEKPGTLFFPIKNFNKYELDSDITISIIHHPLNWFSPVTEDNNKREMEKYLMSTATLQMFGHEHETAFVGQHDYETNLDTLQFCGDIFNDPKKPNKSGFQYLKINLDEETGELIKYSYDSSIYVQQSKRDFDIVQIKEKDFNFSINFKEYLDRINIPLTENGKNLKLSDIYVYPHLDKISLDQNYIYSYIDSSEIVGNSEICNWILAGESQVGKTSLLKKLCQDFFLKGYYPLLLKGKDIKDLKIDQLQKKRFKKNYEEKDNFEKFRQFEKNRKIILIDDFQESRLDSSQKQEFLKSLISLFGSIVITVEDTGDVVTNAKNDFESFSVFSIKPLGHKKTNDLIVKYHTHFQNPMAMERQTFLSQVRRKFDQVSTVLGNRVVPSYPIFLLSILQSLDNASLDLSKTSYGYCYQTLIHTALTVQAKIQNDDIDTYINFLKKFSYRLYKIKTDIIEEDDFLLFYHSYKKIYHFPAYSQAKAKLIASKILIEDDSKIRFGYKYILFYLAAQHISDIILTDEGKNELNYLFENLHIDKNANILVFITHHTNDISFMHDSLFHAMVPFDDFKPITLDKGDPFYSNILDISNTIANNILDHKVDPLKVREKQLLQRDIRERKIEQQSKKRNIPKEVQKSIAPYAQAFASIDIVGQIVKNRKGSLKKEEIIDLIKESYFTGFRTVSSIGNLFEQFRNLLEDETAKKVKSSDSRDVAERKINSFIQILSLYSCLRIFTKLVYAVGLRDFQEVYEEVAQQIDTPAAKIVSLSINSYHNPISVSKVKELVKEVKNNPVAMFIIRECVKSYIYQNYVEQSTKQSLAQLLDMKLSPLRSTRPKRLSRR